MTRYLGLVLITVAFSTNIFAQDSLLVELPKWGLETVFGGGLMNTANNTIDSRNTGPFIADRMILYTVYAPGEADMSDDINYSEGRYVFAGAELSRRIGMDFALYTGFSFSYETDRSSNTSTSGDVNFSSGRQDTVFRDMSSIYGIPFCVEATRPSSDDLERSRRIHSRTVQLGIPLGVRYDFPYIPIRLRGQVAIQAPLVSRFFRRSIHNSLVDDCLVVVPEVVEEDPVFGLRSLSLRGMVGADVRVLSKLRLGIQVEQQFSSSYSREAMSYSPASVAGIEGYSRTFIGVRSAHRPIFYSVVARYALR